MAKQNKRKLTALEKEEPAASAAPQHGDNTTTGGVDRARVAMRAYELYVARGATDGWDLDDWLEAERELSGRADSTDRSSRTEER